MVPLYILGLLLRFGPQHGYQIRKIIGEQLADFTEIKLPTIYYHLERMQADGLLRAESEKPGARPEKTVYSVTDAGRLAFQEMLAEQLHLEYRPGFSSDAVFYFMDHLAPSDVLASLQPYIQWLTQAVKHMEEHRGETLRAVPDDARVTVSIIFSHHMRHYQAELQWATETMQHLKEMEGINHDEGEGH